MADLLLNNSQLQSNVNAASYTITNVVNPSSDQDVATKKYVDALGFVDRGDPATSDWVVGDLTADGNFYDLDCSGVVPAGAKSIIFRIMIKDNVTESYIQMRKKGNSNTIVAPTVRAQAAGLMNDGFVIIACDVNRTVEYRALGDGALTTLSIIILGWFI